MCDTARTQPTMAQDFAGGDRLRFLGTVWRVSCVERPGPGLVRLSLLRERIGLVETEPFVMLVVAGYQMVKCIPE